MTYNYDPANSLLSHKALKAISQKLSQKFLFQSEQDQQEDSSYNKINVPSFRSKLNLSSLRIHSMKKDYSQPLLTKFYNELMIPNFILKDELDDLYDWIYSLDPKERSKEDYNVHERFEMDVLLLICDEESPERKEGVDKYDVKNQNEIKQDTQQYILSGIVLEYYQSAQVGLISYITVSPCFQRVGIMKNFHPVAIEALESLHAESTSFTTPIKAILAEANTFDAGDAPEDVIRNRHQALHSLGYRLLLYPYITPPLHGGGSTFDDIMLLIYQEQGHDQQHVTYENSDDNDNSVDLLSHQSSLLSLCSFRKNVHHYPHNEISSDVLFNYVDDFFMSVFGHDETSIQYYHSHWYYQLSKWFNSEYKTCKISPTLPWDDPMHGFLLQYLQKLES